MSATEVHNASPDAAAANVDMHLEVEIIPVSDVDRSEEFYQRLGWKLDEDDAPLAGLRIVHFPPPGLRGLGHVRHVTHDGRAWLARGGLIVSDIEAPTTTHRPWPRRQRDLARPAVPPRGSAARSRPRAHQLRVVLLLQRSGRQYVAGPGGHDAAPRPDR